MVMKIKLPENNSERRLELILFSVSRKVHDRQGRSVHTYLRFIKGLLNQQTGEIIEDADQGTYEVRLEGAQMAALLDRPCQANEKLGDAIQRICTQAMSNAIGGTIEP